MTPTELFFNTIFEKPDEVLDIPALEKAIKPFFTLGLFAQRFPDVFQRVFVPQLSEQTANLALEMADVLNGNNRMHLKIKEHTDQSEACWCVSDAKEEFATKEEAEEFAKTYDGDKTVWEFKGEYYEIYSDDYPNLEFPMPYSKLRAIAFIYAATQPERFSEIYDFTA